jgi:hypothetical protein
MGTVRDLFYMNEAGYVILGRGLEPSDNNGTQTIVYEKILLDGTVEPIAKTTGNIMISCDGGHSSTGTMPPLRVIPSRDGAVLALIESAADCLSHSLTLTFLDAQTLDSVSETMTVDTEALGEGFGPEGAALSFLTMAWTPDGTFVFSKAFAMADLVTGWEFALDATEGAWVDNLSLDCMHMATSSGSTSQDGSQVTVESDASFSFQENGLFDGCY